MNKYTFTDNAGKTHERISKAAAKKAFAAGKNVIFCPSKMRPFGMWHMECEITSTEWIKDNDSNIDKAWEIVNNSFRFYNCTNETGNYIAYYTA